PHHRGDDARPAATHAQGMAGRKPALRGRAHGRKGNLPHRARGVISNTPTSNAALGIGPRASSRAAVPPRPAWRSHRTTLDCARFLPSPAILCQIRAGLTAFLLTRHGAFA